MKAQRLDESRVALVFEQGDEVVSTLLAYAGAYDLTVAHVTAIGAFSDVELAYFDWKRREYLPFPIDEQVEVLVLAGDIASMDGEPAVHAHVVVGKRDGTTHGGHLLRAHVRPTLELILETSPAQLRRRVDEETGLTLIDPGAA